MAIRDEQWSRKPKVLFVATLQQRNCKRGCVHPFVSSWIICGL
jgi:hypothetical protein